MNTDIKMVPELRFPEFSGEWEESLFEDNYEFKNTNSYSRDKLNYKSGLVKNIHYGDIHTKFKTHFNTLSEELPYINSDIDLSRIQIDNYVQNGDLVIADASEDYDDIGKTIEVININEEKVLAGLHTFLARRKKHNNYLGFFGHILKSKNARLSIMKIAQGTKVLGLSKNRVAKIKLYIPKPDEQQKIANFLTAVDERITLLTQKHEALQDYKKGIMQQIFNQEIRFKDDNGNDFPDWEEKKAKTIFKNHTNKNHDGDLPILSASQKEGMIYRDESGIKIQSSSKSVKSYKIVEPNDFVITLRSFQGGLDFSDKKGICSPAYTILKNIIPVNYFFYKCYFKKERFINRLSKTTIGIRDGKQITYENFGNMLIPYPSPAEQTKIANFLTAIDEKIAGVEQQIETSKTYKRGLLQKMFV